MSRRSCSCWLKNTRSSRSHGKGSADRRLGLAAALSGRGHPAGLENVVPLRRPQREAYVLLDQQYRHLAAAGQAQDGPFDLGDNGGLDAFGGLVEQQEQIGRASCRERG